MSASGGQPCYKSHLQAIQRELTTVCISSPQQAPTPATRAASRRRSKPHAGADRVAAAGEAFRRRLAARKPPPDEAAVAAARRQSLEV